MAAESVTESRAPLVCAINGEARTVWCARLTKPFANASYQAQFDGKVIAYDGKAGVSVNW